MSTQDENIKTLMSISGISEDEAVNRLAFRVAISVGPGRSAAAFETDISELLGRTIQVVSDKEKCDIELAIGCNPLTDASLKLMMVVTEKELKIHTATSLYKSEVACVPDLTRRISSCYAAGYVLARVIGGNQFTNIPDPFIFTFENLGLPTERPSNYITLDDVVLIGAGGIANGFLWAAEELPLNGRLIIVDPKKVSSGNLNRCLFFSSEDVDRNYKAEVLSSKFKRPGLEVEAYVGNFNTFRKAKPDHKVRMVITTVDSRRARRSIQNELPAEVLDASTTDISEIIIHSHRQPNPNACLSCIYPHIPQENQREQHIAEALGVSLPDVQKGFIDEVLAHKLAAIHPNLIEDALLGSSLDTLFKSLCGTGELMTVAGKQAAAPFAFISNLAGALLALELIRFDIDDSDSNGNYVAVDPWRPPHKLLRRKHGRLRGCEFCSNPESEIALRQVWPELNWK